MLCPEGCRCGARFAAEHIPQTNAEADQMLREEAAGRRFTEAQHEARYQLHHVLTRDKVVRVTIVETYHYDIGVLGHDQNWGAAHAALTQHAAGRSIPRVHVTFEEFT